MDFWIGMTHSNPNVARLENWYWTNLTFKVKEELSPYLTMNTRRCAAMRLFYITGYMFTTVVEDNCDQLLRFICKKGKKICSNMATNAFKFNIHYPVRSKPRPVVRSMVKNETVAMRSRFTLGLRGLLRWMIGLGSSRGISCQLSRCSVKL